MTAAPDRVDVGIVSWNTRDLTLDAIDQVFRTAGGLDVRVLLRDNGSTDGTVEAVRRRFPAVDVDAGANIGFAGGVNSLLARSDAPWFLTLNSDAWPEAGALDAMLELAKRQSRAAAVAPLLLRPDGRLEHSTYELPSLRLAAVTGLGLTRLLPAAVAERMLLPGSRAHRRQRAVGWAVGAALLFRRDAVDAIGPLDDSFFMYAEDLEWCWRASRAGWEIWFTPDAVVRHVGNASGSQSFGTRREQIAIRNANQVVRRFHGPTWSSTWRLLNALGAGRLAAWSVLRGRRSQARFWLRQIPAHVGSRDA